MQTLCLKKIGNKETIKNIQDQKITREIKEVSLENDKEIVAVIG